MFLFWTAVFLFFCVAMGIQENETEVLEGTEPYRPLATDFRCYKHALKDFTLQRDYGSIYYVITPEPRTQRPQKIGCMQIAQDQKTHYFYPLPTGRDPMMALYISILYEGIELVKPDKYGSMVSGGSPQSRTKFYCNYQRLIVLSFLEYWETFHSDGETCLKMMELINNCHIFRQMRESFTAKLYEKLCLDEAGCYNVMEYYEDDLPYCVKHMAISKFKNATVGSWHHNIINYCHLTEMISVPLDAKFDPRILKGKAKSELTKMCLYLRHRLLPDEGKETEMPDPDELYELEETTIAVHGNGISAIAAYWQYWTIFFILTIDV